MWLSKREIQKFWNLTTDKFFMEQETGQVSCEIYKKAHLSPACVLSLPVMSDSCDPTDCSLPGSSVHGVLQARILGWVAIFFLRGSSWPRDWTQVSCIAIRLFIDWAMRDLNPWGINSLWVFIFVFSRELRIQRCSWAMKTDVECTSIVILPNNENAAQEASTL